jgi:hypothetical protein
MYAAWQEFTSMVLAWARLAGSRPLPTHMRLEQSIETAAFIRSSVVGQLLLWTNCELQEFLWRMWAN